MSLLPGARQPFSVDPALVERDLRGHAGTQNDLAAVLQAAGIEPRSRLPMRRTSTSPGKPTGQSSSPRSRPSPTTTKKNSSGSASDRSCATATASPTRPPTCRRRPRPRTPTTRSVLARPVPRSRRRPAQPSHTGTCSGTDQQPRLNGRASAHTASARRSDAMAATRG